MPVWLSLPGGCSSPTAPYFHVTQETRQGPLHDLLQGCPKPFCLAGPWPCGSRRGGQGSQHSIAQSGRASRGSGTAWHWVQPGPGSCSPPSGQPEAGGSVRKGQPRVFRACGCAPLALPVRAATQRAPGCHASPSRWAYTTSRAFIDCSAAGRALLHRGFWDQPPYSRGAGNSRPPCADGKSDEVMMSTPPAPAAARPRTPRAPQPLGVGCSAGMAPSGWPGEGAAPSGLGPSHGCSPHSTPSASP